MTPKGLKDAMTVYVKGKDLPDDSTFIKLLNNSIDHICESTTVLNRIKSDHNIYRVKKPITESYFLYEDRIEKMDECINIDNALIPAILAHMAEKISDNSTKKEHLKNEYQKVIDEYNFYLFNLIENESSLTLDKYSKTEVISFLKKKVGLPNGIVLDDSNNEQIDKYMIAELDKFLTLTNCSENFLATIKDFINYEDDQALNNISKLNISKVIDNFLVFACSNFAKIKQN